MSDMLNRTTTSSTKQSVLAREKMAQITATLGEVYVVAEQWFKAGCTAATATSFNELCRCRCFFEKSPVQCAQMPCAANLQLRLLDWLSISLSQQCSGS
jgi:hypothetical protein